MELKIHTLKNNFSNLSTKNSRNICLITAFLLRVIHLSFTSFAPKAGEAESIAQNLAKGLFFRGGTWYGDPLAPSAIVPPLYPLLLFPIYRFNLSWTYLWVLQAVLATAALIAVYRTSKRLAGEKVAVVTLLACSLSPFLVKTAVIVNKTVLQSFFLTWAIEWTTSLFFPLPGDRGAKTKIFMAGLLWGLASLTSSDCAGYCLAILGVSFFFYKQYRKELLKICLWFILIITPWTTWNSYRFKNFVPISTAWGLNFWMGANYQASGSQYALPGKLWHWPKILAERTDSLNEAQKYSLLVKEGIGWIRKNPIRYFKLRLKAAFYFWTTHYQWAKLEGYPGNQVTLTILMTMLLMAGYGIWTAWRERMAGMFILITLFASATILYGLTHADIGDRYRLPLDHYLLLFATYGLFSWWNRRSRGSLQKSKD
jgi:hypothetical protein